MKILLITPESHLVEAPGGIGTYCEHAVAAHQRAENKIKIISWGWQKNKNSLDQGKLNNIGEENVYFLEINQMSIDKYPGLTYCQVVSEMLAPLVDKFNAEFEPDIIETTDYMAPLHVYFEMLRCGIYKKSPPIVVFNHGLTEDTWKFDSNWPSYVEALEDFSREINQLKWCDLILCPSLSAKKHLIKKGIKGVKIEVIAEPFEIADWRNKEILVNRKFAYLGNASYRKGIDAFIFIMNKIYKKLSIEEIVIIGKMERNNFSNDNYYEIIKKKLITRMPDCLVRLMGEYSRDEIANSLKDIDVIFNLSRFETFSYTALEAIANGVSLITYKDSPMAEFIPENLQSMLVLKTPYPSQYELETVLSGWTKNAIIEVVQEYCKNKCNYTNFTEQYIKSVNSKISKNLSITSSNKSNDTIKVTVLIAHFNDGENLVKAVDSCLNQSVKVYHIIIYDDGSTDIDSIAILHALNNMETCEVIFGQGNFGLCHARNVLLESCDTKWCIFLDSDDLLRWDMLEKTGSAALVTDSDAIIPRRINFGINTNIYSNTNINNEYIFVYNNYRMTSLIKTDVASSLGFNDGLRNGEADDWDFWIRFVLSDYQAITYPEPLFLYNFREGSMSWPWSLGQAIGTELLLQKTIGEKLDKYLDSKSDFIIRGIFLKQLFSVSVMYSLNDSLNVMNNNVIDCGVSAIVVDDKKNNSPLPHRTFTSTDIENIFGMVNDDDFVENLYLILFGRHSDEHGKKHYVDRLKKTKSKKLVCAEMLSSPEVISYEFYKIFNDLIYKYNVLKKFPIPLKLKGWLL